MVCDTILDCPDGEDEAGCDELVVRGMFQYVCYNYSLIAIFNPIRSGGGGGC